MDPEACVPPPKVACNAYRSVGSLPESLSGTEAAQVAIAARECGDVIGKPVRELRRAWGKPANNEVIGMGNDSTNVWIRMDDDVAVYVIAGYDKKRAVTSIVLHREYGDSGSPEQFCGEF